MTTPLDLQLNKNYSDEELVVKFNIMGQKTNSNTVRINDLYSKENKFNLALEPRFNTLETNLGKKIDKYNKNMDERMDEIERKYLIKEIKDETSFTSFLNIGLKNVLLKIIEYSLLAIIAYAIMHMKM